jgi:lipoprotein NlpD
MLQRFSKTIFIITLPLFSSGCTQRQDFAPVKTEDQRIPGYHQEAESQRRQMTATLRKPPAIKQTNSGNYSDTFNTYRKPAAATRKKKQSEFARIKPPYQLERGQRIKLFNPLANENAGKKRINANTAVASHEASPANKSINSSNNGIKTETKVAGQQVKLNNQGNNKKKSIISIDNKNMLMLNFQWPIKGKIRKNFSQTDKKGIDIVGEIGQTVRAAETGKVVYSGQGLIGFGNLLIIKHNDEYLSAYANNGSLLVKEGQQVKKGQDIAKAGVAVSKKALLHFEIRKNGKSLNPLSLLPKK